MMTTKRYLDFLLKAKPDVLRRRACLYIGAHPGKGLSFLQELRHAGYVTTIIEAWEQNVKDIMPLLENGEEIIHADIRAWVPPRRYDLVLWWHGPEHVPLSNAGEMLERLKEFAKGAVIVGAPWGSSPQGPAYGNPFEQHVSNVTEEFLESHGYEVATYGIKDKPCNGQIMGWFEW